MDKTTQNNQAQWDQLVRSDVPCGRPREDLDPTKAQEWLNEGNILGDLAGKNVLCLASGGGQQSLGFAMLDANVTVVDFSEEQLKKDKLVAEKYSKSIRIIQTDMRDLSMFEDGEFDIVYQPYSINYIPDSLSVFDEVLRITKVGGIYHLMFHNPFVHGSWKDGCWGSEWESSELWNGKGYPIWQKYEDGNPIETLDPNWNFSSREGEDKKVESPREFKHTLSTVLNGLIDRGFSLMRFDEYTGSAPDGKPGTWDHYTSVAAPWFFLWVRKISA